MAEVDRLKFAFLLHTVASKSTDTTTQLIISSQQLHLLGVGWLDWSLDENTDIVLSLHSNNQQGNFHLTYLFYKAFVWVPSFNSYHWPASLCKARNQHIKKTCFQQNLTPDHECASTERPQTGARVVTWACLVSFPAGLRAGSGRSERFVWVGSCGREPVSQRGVFMRRDGR